MAEKSIVRSLIGDDLAEGNFIDYAKENPAKTASFLATSLSGTPMLSPLGMGAGLVSRGIDSYNDSVAADKGLQADGM